MAQATRTRMAHRAAAGLLAALFVAGCSVSVGGDKRVSRDEVAEKASGALAAKVGKQPDDVLCKDDLKAEVGATVRCELTVDGRKLGMTVTATAVDGDNVKMDFKVDDAPGATEPTQPTGAPSAGGEARTVNRAEVARKGKAALTAQVGREPDAFICKQDLPARVGATVRCQLAADGKQYGVTATVTSVSGGNVRMNFKVDETPNGG